MSERMSTSPSMAVASSQAEYMDPINSFLDLSNYDNGGPYQSPSMSPAETTKVSFHRPVKPEPQTSLLSTSQPLSGPSHQYDLYKQQTGIVPGALASTLAISQNNAQIQSYSGFGLDYNMFGNSDDTFNFNTPPSQASLNPSEIEMEFDSPSAATFMFEESTINPRSIGGQETHSLPSVVPTQGSSVGRVWPGMHSQAALAKAQQQQRQQQTIILQQQQQQQLQQQKQQSAQPRQPNRTKMPAPSDPLVEQKIHQLITRMRAQVAVEDGSQHAPVMNISRPKKDEDDMDEDERLLASEEGKKLTSRERRQLRNKVSARAFRSRRKEYINQLEAEIAAKVAEVGDLRSHNRALVEENQRLVDLTHMLLQSPSFSDFLDRMSTDPQLTAQTQAQPVPRQQPQQHNSRQLPKDMNPYAVQPHQIGLAMIPEQSMDLGLLNLDAGDASSYNILHPQVYAVLETPEPPPMIDTFVFSGKTSNFVGEQFDADEEKVEIPAIEKVPAMAEQPEDEEVETTETSVVDEEFENDPAFALYHDSPATAVTINEPVELDTEGFSHVDIFGGIEPEKALARFELVNASEEDAIAAFAMARVQRMSASLDSVMARLEILTVEF